MNKLNRGTMMIDFARFKRRNQALILAVLFALLMLLIYVGGTR